MAHLVNMDKVVGAVVLTLALVALAAGLSTDAYSHGAQAEAKGYNALSRLIVNNGNSLCVNDAVSHQVAPVKQTPEVVQ